jgi:hypothetical protein
MFFAQLQPCIGEGPVTDYGIPGMICESQPESYFYPASYVYYVID